MSGPSSCWGRARVGAELMSGPSSCRGRAHVRAELVSGPSSCQGQVGHVSTNIQQNGMMTEYRLHLCQMRL